MFLHKDKQRRHNSATQAFKIEGTCPARLKGRVPKLATLEGRPDLYESGLRGSGGSAPPDRCAYGFIERGGPGHRRGQAAPSRAGAAPELGRHYAAAGRATSHNGVRYAFVHPKAIRDGY